MSERKIMIRRALADAVPIVIGYIPMGAAYAILARVWPEVFGFGWIVLFSAALIGTLAEALPRPFDDNLTIPLAVGMFLTFVS